MTALAVAATQPPVTPDPDSVSPGLAGFLVVFALALATWALARSMTGRIRKVRRRAELEELHGRSPDEPDSGPATSADPADGDGPER